jgi:hypothetical protein
MKRIAVILVLVLGFSFAAAAHPPTDIIITFNLAKSAVMADIVHDSKDITKHYIVQVVVTVNGKEAVKQHAVTQTGNDGQNVMYVIPGLKIGDKVSVDADCSIFGDLTKDAVVTALEQPQQTRQPSAKPAAKASSKFKVK